MSHQDDFIDGIHNFFSFIKFHSPKYNKFIQSQRVKMYMLILFCKHTFFWGQGIKSYSIEKYIFETSNDFIRWFHLSRIPNLRIFSNENWSWFLFQPGNWEKKGKKTVFGFITKPVFFFNCSNWEKFVGKNRETNWWKQLLNSLIIGGKSCWKFTALFWRFFFNFAKFQHWQ